MSGPKIVVVVPTIRPESHAQFVKAWTPLFEKHKVTLVTVWDGDEPRLTGEAFGKPWSDPWADMAAWRAWRDHRDLFCRRTDACRNLGFVAAAAMNPDYVLTMDDDVHPVEAFDHALNYSKYQDGSDKAVDFDKWCSDPIQSHLDALQRRVPLSWMNTAHDTDLYLRGVPYRVREESQVMLSHGVWVGTPDFDGETQLRLETCPLCKGTNRLPNFYAGQPDTSCVRCAVTPSKLPHSLPYYVGPVPRGVLFPLCGMNVMIHKNALPYFYFAPMGQDAGVFTEREVDQSAGGTHTFKIPTLHRFADIFMGVFLKRQFDALGWACVTGYSTVLHTRASDAKKNFEAEKLGREWMEQLAAWEQDDHPYLGFDPQFTPYFRSYADKRTRYAELIRSIQGGK